MYTEIIHTSGAKNCVNICNICIGSKVTV